MRDGRRLCPPVSCWVAPNCDAAMNEGETSIAFSAEHYQANIYDGQYYYVTPCTAAYAVFDELEVVSVRITLEVPKGQKTVNVSEIKILGK